MLANPEQISSGFNIKTLGHTGGKAYSAFLHYAMSKCQVVGVPAKWNEDLLNQNMLDTLDQRAHSLGIWHGEV
jgi:hypothetical protein